MLCCHIPPILYHNTHITKALTLVHLSHVHPILLSGWSVHPSLFPFCFTWGHSKFLIRILYKRFYIAFLLGGGDTLGCSKTTFPCVCFDLWLPDLLINPIICTGFFILFFYFLFFWLCNLLHIVFMNRWDPLIHWSPDTKLIHRYSCGQSVLL